MHSSSQTVEVLAFAEPNAMMASGSGQRVLKSGHHLFHLLQENLGGSYLTHTECRAVSMQIDAHHATSYIRSSWYPTEKEGSPRIRQLRSRGRWLGPALYRCFLATSRSLFRYNFDPGALMASKATTRSLWSSLRDSTPIFPFSSTLSSSWHIRTPKYDAD